MIPIPALNVDLMCVSLYVLGKNQDLLNIFVCFTIKSYLLLFKPILPSKQMW